MHQLGDLLWSKFTQLAHQDFGFRQEVGLGEFFDGCGGFFIEVFSGGKDEKHDGLGDVINSGIVGLKCFVGKFGK